MNCTNVNEPIIGDFSLRQIETIIKQSMRYHPPGTTGYPITSSQYYSFPDLRLKNIGHDTSWDDDGYPIEKFLKVFKWKGEERKYGENDWEVSIGYESVYNDDFDFTETIRRSRSDEHRIMSAAPPEEFKFKLRNYWHSKPIDDLCRDLAGLQDLFSHLDSCTSTLEAWVDSGLGVAMICAQPWCQRAVVYMPNVWMRDQLKPGLSLQDIEGRMRCTHCRERNGRLRPYPDHA